MRYIICNVQVLAKTLDSTALTTDKLEVSTITRDESHGGRVCPRALCHELGNSGSIVEFETLDVP